MNHQHTRMNKRASNFVKFDANRPPPPPPISSRIVRPPERNQSNRFNAQPAIRRWNRRQGGAGPPARQNVARQARFDTSRPPPVRRNLPTATKKIYSNRGARRARRGNRPPVAETSTRQNVHHDARTRNAEEQARATLNDKLMIEFSAFKTLIFSSIILTLFKILEECVEVIISKAMPLGVGAPLVDPLSLLTTFVSILLPSLQNMSNILERKRADAARFQNSETPETMERARSLLLTNTPSFFQTFMETLQQSYDRVQSTRTATANQREGDSNQQNRPEERSSPSYVPQVPSPPFFRHSPAPATYIHSQTPPARARYTSPLLQPPMDGASTSRATQPARDEQGTPPRPYRNSRWHRPQNRYRSPRFEPYYQRYHH